MTNDITINNTMLYSLNRLTTIRQQASRLLKLVRKNELDSFVLHDDKMAATADFVLEVIENQYPSFVIPYHSRWRQFEAGDGNSLKKIEHCLAELPKEERGKILYELVIISVLLDAGAGNQWYYRNSTTGQIFRRSEGLAMASLALYEMGGLSHHVNQPLRVDAERLTTFTLTELTQNFQISRSNPLAGSEGRVRLLNRLGQVIKKYPLYFGQEGRLGNFYSYIVSLSDENKHLAARDLFNAVLKAFNEIWPERLYYPGVTLGDVWAHPALKTEQVGSELMPFHKLSQWLTYSLIEPLEWAGINVFAMDELTGLAEYRNGGLLIDLGLLEVKDKACLQQPMSPASPVIVAWRALTIALLDELADTIRQKLHCTAQTLPLSKILQGGTWEAGRRIAQQKRADGSPPMQIISDGTIF